jgi:hypothetical protein
MSNIDAPTPEMVRGRVRSFETRVVKCIVPMDF